MKRVAAIDCGTNSIRLLIADVDHAGTSLREVTRLMEIVRLGQGVDRTGKFHPEALARTLEATGRYAQLCRDHGVQAVRFVATSASRDASNREEFFAGVQDRLGVEVEIITGSQEAALSFMGATSVLPDRADLIDQQTGDGDDGINRQAAEGEEAAGHDVPARCAPDPEGAAERLGAGRLVVDIGGGSTELVLGTDRTLQSDTSMNIGCVRMAERHLISDPPSPEEIARARADIDAALDEAEREVPLSQVRTVVGVAGSVTTVTAHALGLPEYDRSRINGTRLPLPRVHEACHDLLHMPRHRRAELPYMHPGRVDVIGAGALVWTAVLDRIDNRVRGAGGELGPIVTSEHDILDGIALSMA